MGQNGVHDSDERLMKRYADGDERAFQVLFQRYGQRLYNYFLQHLGNREQAEDLLQDCFIRLIRSRDQYRPDNRFKGWIFTIAANLLRDRYRQKGREQRRREAISGAAEIPGGAASPLPPDITVEQSEVNALLTRALQQLPEAQRHVIILAKYQGFSFEEIGQMLGCSGSAAKQKGYRAMQQLKEILIKSGKGAGDEL